MLPLGAPPGKTTKLTVRGLHLDQAKEVQVSSGGKAKIVSKGAAAAPDKNPEKVGDTQVIVELTLPADLAETSVQVTVSTPAGATKPHALLVDHARVIAEKEPNPGFRDAQPLKLPVVVDGTIGSPRDVDVFRIEGLSGQKIKAEILAERHGSPLDAMLTLYDQKGSVIAHADDKAASRDPILEATLPADGVYFLSLIDAHDTGSNLHVYRLLIRLR